MNRRDFQELSKVRLKEARALFDARLCDGAYYLAGYAVECALKACIAKGTRRHEFPEKRKVEISHSHNVRELVKVAGLEEARIDRVKGDPEFENSWDVVQNWSEQSRYRKNRPEEAEALLDAVAGRRHGVISWIKTHW